MNRRSIASVSWWRQRIWFLWAYNRNDAVAAQGSNANSSLPGVILGVGGFNFVSDLLELLEVDRCLDNCPADMSRVSIEVMPQLVGCGSGDITLKPMMMSRHGGSARNQGLTGGLKAMYIRRIDLLQRAR